MRTLTGQDSLLTRRMREFVERAARCAEPVLLFGETGSGKTYLARLIHESGARARRPFQAVNCTAIPEALFERELFGHVRGAFTGARQSSIGLVEAASGGTLFLDEIGELPLTMQSKLLTALEEHWVRRLGATTVIPIDVRVITATNASLTEMVQLRRFRHDLYHRIAVLTFRVPSLRERGDEFPQLVNYLLRRASTGGAPPIVSDDAYKLLAAYDWPGNIRELDNVLRRAVIFAEGGTIRPQDLAEEIRDRRHLHRHDGGASNRPVSARYQWTGTPDEELRRVHDALTAESGNRTRAARRLGMSRSTLWVKIQRAPAAKPPLEPSSDEESAAKSPMRSSSHARSVDLES